MRALVCSEFSGPQSLRVADAPDPGAPGPDQVRLRVTAAGVNFADLLITAGKYQVKPALPFVPGFEAAGIVEAVGASVHDLRPGERVMAFLDHGGMAEFAIVDAAMTFAVPDAMSDAIAGGFPIAYGTSYMALAQKARLQAGEVLLVTGASGGVGLTAVEIGAALGATVVAVAGGADKCAIAKAHGAHFCIDYRTENVRERAKALVGGVDVVYDPVGGASFETGIRLANWDARLLVVGFAGGDVQEIPANILLVKNISALGFYFGSYRKRRPDLVRAAFAGLIDLWRRGSLDPLISAKLPIEEFSKAFSLIAERRVAGKIVLAP